MTEQPFLVPSLLFLAASVPLICGLVPRNWYYGIRTAKTLSEDRIWYAANRFGGWSLSLSSLVYLVFAKLAPYSKATHDFSVWLRHLGAFAVPLLVSLLLLRRRIRSL